MRSTETGPWDPLNGTGDDLMGGHSYFLSVSNDFCEKNRSVSVPLTTNKTLELLEQTFYFGVFPQQLRTLLLNCDIKLDFSISVGINKKYTPALLITIGPRRKEVGRLFQQNCRRQRIHRTHMILNYCHCWHFFLFYNVTKNIETFFDILCIIC